MLRDAAVDILMLRLGKRTDATLKDVIIAEMSFAQTEILEQDPTLPWFLAKKSSSLVTVADTELVAVPTDFLQEYPDSAVYITNSAGKQVSLFREDLDVMQEDLGEDSTGLPTYYDLVGEDYIFRLIPDDAYTLTTWYYGKGADLSGVYGDGNNVENTWLKHAGALLMAHTGILVAKQYLQSDPLAQMFGAQIQGAQDRLMKKNTAMEETNKQRFMEG